MNADPGNTESADTELSDTEPGTASSGTDSSDTEPGTDSSDTEPDTEPGVETARRMWTEDQASRGLGMECVLLEAEHAIVRMPIAAAMVNGHEIAHGGFIFTLADSAFALSCNSRGPVTVAAGADISFILPAHLGDVLLAEARERAAYGRNGITDVSVTRESDGLLVAEFRGRSRTLPPRRPTEHETAT